MREINVAICDDEETDLRQTVEAVQAAAEQKSEDFKIYTFTSPDKLLHSAVNFDIVVLDVEMDEMTGLELAQRMSEKDPECYKIFVSHYPTYLDKTLDAYAVRYLTKPIEVNRLSEGMDTILERMRRSKKKLHITQYSNKLPTEIDISTILYIETARRHTKIVSAEYGEFMADEIFADVKKMIEKEVNYFCQPHQSFYVNLKYVVKYDKDKVILAYADRTYETAMSRRQFKAFDDGFFRLAKKA